MHSDEWFTLAELTERLGGLVWVEEAVSEVLGGWSAIEAAPAAAILFASTGHHHRWHGEIIRGCLPTSPQLRAEDMVRPPTPGWQAASGTLRGLHDPEATTARLKAVVKVIDPWLEREIGALRELARPVSDAALSRWTRFVSIDHEDDGQAAELLLAARASAAVRFDDHVTINELDLS